MQFSSDFSFLNFRFCSPFLNESKLYRLRNLNVLLFVVNRKKNRRKKEIENIEKVKRRNAQFKKLIIIHRSQFASWSERESASAIRKIIAMIFIRTMKGQCKSTKTEKQGCHVPFGGVLSLFDVSQLLLKKEFFHSNRTLSKNNYSFVY